MADLGDLSARIPMPGARPPWRELEFLRPLTLRACRRLVVVAPHPRDEIRAAGGLLRRLAARHASVDVLALTDGPGRTCTPPEGLAVPDAAEPRADLVVRPEDLQDPETLASVLVRLDGAGPVEDADDDASGADPEEAALAAAYRTLGVAEVRRHRLGLPDGGLSRHEADVVGALSEIVGFVEDPHGLCVLAPWSGDGDDDHEAAGRAAEIVCAAYRVRLVRWLDQAWSWAGPESAEVPWRRARQLALSETVQARKLAASAAFGDRPGRDRELPDGSAPGPREVFLV
ncbi:MAG TPA: PIG-L family deacetylase [Actinomycetospora sp.]|nr:PIG-L family deacetylase [Actinomycetospora sp.]